MVYLTIPCIVCKGSKAQELRDIDGNVIGTKPCESCGATGVANAGTIDIAELTDSLNWIKAKIKKIIRKLGIVDVEEEQYADL